MNLLSKTSLYANVCTTGMDIPLNYWTFQKCSGIILFLHFDILELVKIKNIIEGGSRYGSKIFTIYQMMSDKRNLRQTRTHPNREIGKKSGLCGDQIYIPLLRHMGDIILFTFFI